MGVHHRRWRGLLTFPDGGAARDGPAAAGGDFARDNVSGSRRPTRPVGARRAHARERGISDGYGTKRRHRQRDRRNGNEQRPLPWRHHRPGPPVSRGRHPGTGSPPSGSIPPIPRWDANPERIGVERGHHRPAAAHRAIERHRRIARRAARLRGADLYDRPRRNEHRHDQARLIADDHFGAGGQRDHRRVGQPPALLRYTCACGTWWAAAFRKSRDSMRTSRCSSVEWQSRRAT